MKNKKFAIIVSRFNQAVTQKLLQGAKERLIEKEIAPDNIKVIEVPGAVEIPLVAKKLASIKQFDAIITLGAVVRGETTHYDYVCEQVSNGVAKVMYDYEIPVVFGVITVENRQQAFDRVGGAHGHKGVDAADCALEMINVMDQIND